MSQSSNEVQYDRKDLKIQALLEKLSQQDNQIADLRVEVTVLQQQLREVISNAQQQAEAHDVVQGEVVQDVPQTPNSN